MFYTTVAETVKITECGEMRNGFGHMVWHHGQSPSRRTFHSAFYLPHSACRSSAFYPQPCRSMVTVDWWLGFVILTADPVSLGCVSVELSRSVIPLPTYRDFWLFRRRPCTILDFWKVEFSTAGREDISQPTNMRHRAKFCDDRLNRWWHMVNFYFQRWRQPSSWTFKVLKFYRLEHSV